MRQIAITGGKGRLGYFITRQLERQGYGIRHLRAYVPQGLAGDDFRPFLDGCEGLVHAALSHIPGRYRGGEGQDPESFWQLNHGGTVRLMTQAREMGVRRGILFSSRAVYGAHQHFDRPIDEHHVPEPDTLYGKLKWATEQWVAQHSSPDFALTALRPTGVYGGPPEINKWTPLFHAALRGDLPAQNRSSTEIHGQTIGQAVTLILNQNPEKVAGQTFNLIEVKTTSAEILGFAGIDTRTLPEPTPQQGPELSGQRIKDLGLDLLGIESLRTSAAELCLQLRQSLA